MNRSNRTSVFWMGVMALGLGFAACQKMERPVLGDFPQDANPPGGTLSFFAAFDGTSPDPLMNAVDSIRATFPGQNPLMSVEGVSGKAVQGEAKKFIQYPSFNNWTQSSSFTVSVWFKKDGPTKNNEDGTGPEHIFSLRSSVNDYHWSNAVMFLFLEGDNNACAVKSMCVSPSNPADPTSSPTDSWFTWEGGQSIPGLLNNQWHHLALIYNELTSEMMLYIDGVPNPNVKTWANHGPIRLATQRIGEHRVGRGPRNDDEGDGASGWLQSSFKGNLDQFRLYNVALPASEIQSLYSAKQ